MLLLPRMLPCLMSLCYTLLVPLQGRVTVVVYPNIANHILTSHADINLKGLVGNGVCHCSGEHCYGDVTRFNCKAPTVAGCSSAKVVPISARYTLTAVVDAGTILYGHGMISTDTYMQIWEECGYLDIYNGGTGTVASQECREATKQASLEHGNFNVVNVYDNCPPFKQQEVAQFYQRTQLTPVSLAKILRENLHDLPSITAELVEKAGGFSWSCEEESIYPIYMSVPTCEKRSLGFTDCGACNWF